MHFVTTWMWLAALPVALVAIRRVGGTRAFGWLAVVADLVAAAWISPGHLALGIGLGLVGTIAMPFLADLPRGGEPPPAALTFGAVIAAVVAIAGVATYRWSTYADEHAGEAVVPFVPGLGDVMAQAFADTAASYIPDSWPRTP